MLHVVAYDISSPRKLERVARICEDYGQRIEKSVFECDLEDGDFASFWSRLERTIDPSRDSIIDYPVCKSCERNIRTLGQSNRPEKGAWVF